MGFDSMKEIKIVSAKEMERIEKLAIQKGCNEEEFVIRAGRSIADAAEEWIERHHGTKHAVILAGKGNKGADAFAAGVELLSKGFRLQAYHLESMDLCRPLCRKFAERFQKMGGIYREVRNKAELVFNSNGLIIDGLLGTGFTGPVAGLYLAAIKEANQSGLPILAVDIPSGLNGSTGDIEGAAIEAQLTVAMGLPKVGFFLQDGWNCVGELYIGDFGLPPEFVDQAKETANMPCWQEMHKLLPRLKRNRHKYQTGCVVGYAGSSQLSGAAKLASCAALRSGAGIVKLFFPPDAAACMTDLPYEIIRMPWTKNAWNEALSKAKSVFVGPGLGRSEEAKAWIETVLAKLRLPVVLDADALLEGMPFPKLSICTPHRGEMMRLLGKESLDEEKLLKACQGFCEEKKNDPDIKRRANVDIFSKTKAFHYLAWRSRYGYCRKRRCSHGAVSRSSGARLRSARCSASRSHDSRIVG